MIENIEQIDEDIFKVALVGVSQKMRPSFSFFFNQHGNGRFRLSESDDADLIIIDIDHPEGKEFYKHLPAIDNYFVALMATTDPRFDNAHYLSKPLRASRLSEVLNNCVIAKEKAQQALSVQKKQAKDSRQTETIKEKAQSQGEIKQGGVKAITHVAEGLTEDLRVLFQGVKEVDLSNDRERSKVFFNPKRFLLDSLCQAYTYDAFRKGCVLDWEWGKLRIIPQKDLIQLDRKKGSMRALMSRPLTHRVKLKAVDLVRLNEDTNDNWYSFSSFLWETSMWTSRGRLPLGLHLEDNISLKHWPNLTRLKVIRNAMRVSAILNARSFKIIDLVQKIGTQATVFAFITAANSLGMIRIHSSEKKLEKPYKPLQNNKKSSIIKKILERLYKGG